VKDERKPPKNPIPKGPKRNAVTKHCNKAFKIKKHLNKSFRWKKEVEAMQTYSHRED
jgi:hypothetical protein